MVIREELVHVLRSQLAAESDADLDEPARQLFAAERTASINGLGELLYAVFKCAVRNRWATGWTLAEIVRFVADVRSSADEAAAAISAAAAENQLRLALGDQVAPYPDMEARGRAQFFLLLALTADYTPEDLDALMAWARRLTRAYAASPVPDRDRGGWLRVLVTVATAVMEK